MNLSDERILQLLAEGAPEGVEALYDTYGGLAYTIALRVLNDGAAAEDVVQEAFLSVWRRAITYTSTRGSLRSWLGTVVRHRAIDRLRGNRSRTKFDVPLDIAEEHSSVSDTWAEVEAGLTRQSMKQALAELPVEQRQTIELAYYGGYTQAEIGKAMDVPLGTVKGRARMGLTKLHTVLTGMDVTWQNH